MLQAKNRRLLRVKNKIWLAGSQSYILSPHIHMAMLTNVAG